MNREIKFRFWDLLKKEMTLRFRLTFDGIPFEDIQYDGLNFYREDRIVVMQYTGLKDKNGKEIYEWDIVYIDAYGHYNIQFKDGRFISYCIEKYGLEGFMFDEDLLINGNSENVKVIGNIFENPELNEEI